MGVRRNTSTARLRFLNLEKRALKSLSTRVKMIKCSLPPPTPHFDYTGECLDSSGLLKAYSDTCGHFAILPKLNIHPSTPLYPIV